MNIIELKIKFQELKANLLNQRTQATLKNEINLNMLINCLDNYIENIEQISDVNLLAILENKLSRSIYITNRGVSNYLNEFINNVNFLIESQPKKVNDNYFENIESKINEEEFSLRYDKLIEFLNFDTEESNLILETPTEKKPFKVYKTKNDSLSFYAASTEKAMIISKEKLINIYLEKEEARLVYAKVIITKIVDNSIFDFFIKIESTDLLEVIKKKLIKNENDLLILKNNLESIEKESQSTEDKKIEFNEILEKAKTAQQDYLNAKNAAIEDSKLKDSVKYWEEKQEKHEKQFDKYKSIAIGLIFGLVCVLSLILFLHNYQLDNKKIEIKQTAQSIKNEDNNLVKEKQNIKSESEFKAIIEKQDDNNLKDFDYSKLAWYALMIFASSSAFWIIRITVKIALSNLHLSEDAHERVVMIQTYLAFVKEGELKDGNEDKKLILSSLFRPSSIGIIQDESSVTVTDIITAFKK